MIEATHSDRNTVVEILANSFDDNKSVNYIIKQDRHRELRIKQLMGYSFDVCNRFGRVLLSENKKACALIVFPDEKRTTLKSMLWDTKLITNCKARCSCHLFGVKDVTLRSNVVFCP